MIFLMGPTAVGKTALSIALAKHFPCEIISVDSVMVYRGLDIGSAKPDLNERAGIPHHLINIREPWQVYSVAEFVADVQKLVQQIQARGKIPLLAGGTLLYFNALINGIAAMPTASPQIRTQIAKDIEHHGLAAMHQQLAEIDPQAARKIHPHDPQRIARALEVYRLTGKSLTAWCQNTHPIFHPSQYQLIQILPSSREQLHQRIAQRFEQMLEQGIVDEVAQLMKEPRMTAELPAMRAVGYRQVRAYLCGNYDFDSMHQQAVIATRQFAKRQLTWLRRLPRGLCYCYDEPGLFNRIIIELEKYFEKN